MSLEDYQKGVQEGQKHARPSEETIKELNKIQTNCAKNTTKFAQMLEEIQKDVGEIADDIKAIKEDLKENYISQKEFKPYKDKVNKVAGFIWGILIACGVIVVALILKSSDLPTP